MEKRRQSKKSLANRLSLLQALWKMHHEGGVGLNEIQLKYYRKACKENHVGNQSFKFATKYILQETMPTMEDASKYGIEVTDYATAMKLSREALATIDWKQEVVEQAEVIEEVEEETLPENIEFDGETMSSLFISKVTGKPHNHVMRDIRNLLAQGVSSSNFGQSAYTNSRGKEYPCYNLTKKGCLILASGYDALLREKIIDRWEALETGKAQPMVKSGNPLEVVLQQTRALAQVIEASLEQEKKLNDLKNDFEEYKSEQEKRRADAIAELSDTELSSDPAAPITPRSAINKLIRNYADANNLEYRDCWNQLYSEFTYRYHTDLKKRAEFQKEKPLDYAEKNGFIKWLYALASHLFGKKK